MLSRTVPCSGSSESASESEPAGWCLPRNRTQTRKRGGGGKCTVVGCSAARILEQFDVLHHLRAHVFIVAPMKKLRVHECLQEGDE
jgi:hypothetical protein